MEKERTKPTRSQVETLMSDWLQGTRDAETFIHKNTQGAIYTKTSKGTALSEYSRGKLDDCEQADVLRQSRSIAQGVVDGMTDEPVRVIMGGTTSYTDGKTICVSTDYFDDNSLTLGEKVDILSGYAIHEACHIRHSDFKILSKTRDRDPEVNRLKRDIDNILEDERIEHLLGEPQENGGDGMPGLSDYLGCCKRHSFGKYKQAKKDMKPDEALPSFLESLLGAVRYPAMLTEEMVTRHFDELDAVRKILRPFPKSPQGVMSATDRIVDVIKDMLDKEDGQDGSGDQSRQDAQDGGHKGEEAKKDGRPQGSADGSGKDASRKLADALRTTQSQAILAAAEKANNAPDGGDANNAACLNKDRKGREYVNGDCEKDVGDGAGGLNSITYIHHAKGSREDYEDALKNVKRYIPAMAKALRCRATERDYELMGERSGKLNTNKLVSLKTGNVNIFTRRGEVTSDKACLCLLLDESGSMSQDGRQKATRETAILINEAVRHINNLKLFIYGYNDNDINIYHEGGREDRWSLGSTRASGGTPTAEAMRIAAERIRRQTQDGCLMLVLTDGEPNDIKATKQQDETLSRNKFLTIGVDLVGGTKIKEVFRNSISTENMQTLAPTLAVYVRKKLQKMIGRHDETR